MVSHQFANISLCSLPIKARYGSFHQCVPECLIGECCSSHEFEVCTLEGIFDVFVVENGHHRKLFCPPPHSSKKSSVDDSPANRCKSSEKATAKGFAVCAKTPSDVNVCGPSGRCPHIAAIVCKCAWLCSVIACHHSTLLIAISPRAGNTSHLWKSRMFVQLRPWLSVAAWSRAFPLERERRFLYFCQSVSIHLAMLRTRRGPGSTHSRFGKGRSGVCDSRVSVRTKSLAMPSSSPPSPVICTRFPLCCYR